jgi:hypothetical protein
MTDDPGRVTIENLVVSFHVEGDDRAVFARLFREEMSAWEDAKARRRAGDREQNLGDQPGRETA